MRSSFAFFRKMHSWQRHLSVTSWSTNFFAVKKSCILTVLLLQTALSPKSVLGKLEIYGLKLSSSSKTVVRLFILVVFLYNKKKTATLVFRTTFAFKLHIWLKSSFPNPLETCFLILRMRREICNRTVKQITGVTLCLHILFSSHPSQQVIGAAIWQKTTEIELFLYESW